MSLKAGFFAMSIFAGLSVGLAAADLQQLVDQAVSGGAHTLSLPRATYRVSDTLQFRKLQDFTLDGNGSLILVTRNVTGIEIERCRNFKLANLTLDYDPLPFTQGVVKEVDAAANTFLFEIHRGYPDLPRMERLNFHVFNASDRLWKDGVPDLFGCGAASEGGHGYRVQARAKLAGRLAPGDLVAVDWRQNYGISVKSSENVTLDGIAINASPGLAIIARFNTGKQLFERITIGRGERLPAGATEPRLLSSAADGVNVAYCGSGPEIVGCDFSFLGDDSVNLHSVALPVVRSEAPDTILTLRAYPRESFPEVVKPGMTLRILRKGDFTILSESKIAGFEYVDEPIDTETVMHYYPRFNPKRDPRYSTYRIRLAQPVDIPAGSFVDIPALSGSGFVIRDNYFHDHRARALRIMACDGLIEGNRIERIKQNAITVGAEYGFWREAGWAENVTIRKNVIRDVGTDERLTSPGSYAPGAISLFIRPEPGVEAVASGNRNISIIDNEIDGCSGPGIVLHAVDGAKVSGNRVVNVCKGDVSRAGADYGFKITGPLVVTPSAVNVTVENEK